MGCTSSSQSHEGFFSDIDLTSNKEATDEFGRRKANQGGVHEWVPTTNFERVTYKKSAKTTSMLVSRLAEHHLFESLGKGELKELVGAMQAINVPVGAELISLGSTMREMYVVEVGELTGLREEDPSKGRAAKEKTFRPGDFIGDRALLSEATAQAKVTCTGDANAVVWAIEGGTYRNTLAANGERLAQMSRIRQALTQSPVFLETAPSDVIEQVVNEIAKPQAVNPGASIISNGASVNQLYMIATGTVKVTMKLRPDEGVAPVKKGRGIGLRTSSTSTFASSSSSTSLDPSTFASEAKRPFEAGPGQILGGHAYALGLSGHVWSCSAKTKVELVPLSPSQIPNLIDPSKLNEAIAERVLTALPVFGNFHPKVMRTLFQSMPTITFKASELIVRQGNINSFLFIVKSGSLLTAHSDRTRVSSRSSLPGPPSKAGSMKNRSSSRKSSNTMDTEEDGNGGIIPALAEELTLLAQPSEMPQRLGNYDYSGDEIKTKLGRFDVFGLAMMAEDMPGTIKTSLVAEAESEVMVCTRAMYQRALLEAKAIRRANKQKKLTAAKAAEESSKRTRTSFFGRSSFAAKPKKSKKSKASADEMDDDEDNDEDVNTETALTSEWKFLSDPSITLPNLREVSVLGRGAFGVVRRVRDKNTGEEYALKALAKPSVKASHGGRGMEKLVRERDAQVLCGGHPFVTHLINTYEDNRAVFILMELHDGMELFDVLYRKDKTGQNGPLSMESARFVFANVVMALGHLHAKEHCYRDLKPENCMITKNGYVKLVDFGFCKHLSPGEKAWTLCGTAEYLAPEIVLGTGHDTTVDWWSLGILAYELRCGKTPFDYQEESDDVFMGGEGDMEEFERRRRNQIMHNIISMKLRMPKNKFDEGAEKTIKRLLKRDVASRLGCRDNGGTEAVKKSPWTRSMNWKAMYEQTMTPPALRGR